MNRWCAIFVLVVAAGLEAGGDALVRFGIHAHTTVAKALFFLVAMLVLFAYGWMVNAPPWDFGRLLGLYVVFFFVIAQLLSWLVFKQPPSTAMLLGGCLILAGGAVISLSSL